MTAQEKLKRIEDSPSAAQSHFEAEPAASDINDAVSRLVNGPSKEYEVCVYICIFIYRVTHLLAEKVMLTSVLTHTEVI